MSYVNEFLNRLMTTYGDPRRDNMEQFMGEYIAALSGFSDRILHMACNRVISERDSPYWPTPGVCRKAAAAVSDEIEAEKRRRGSYGNEAWRADLPPVRMWKDPKREEIYRLAAEWRATLPNNYWDKPSIAINPRSDRQSFTGMQRESRNHHLHRKPLTLTARSRAMTGEDGE